MNYKHGKRQTSEFETWSTMKARCLNPRNSKYKNYGARGIKVCDRWMSFTEFFEDMGKRPTGMTLDRINVNGDYAPDNCRWATPREQANNRTTNRTVTLGCVTLTLAEWGCEMGFSAGLVSNRMGTGWGEVDAITRQVGRKKIAKNEESRACE